MLPLDGVPSQQRQELSQLPPPVLRSPGTLVGYSENQELLVPGPSNLHTACNSGGTESLSAGCHVVGQIIGADGLMPGPGALVTFPSPSTTEPPPPPPGLGGAKVAHVDTPLRGIQG